MPDNSRKQEPKADVDLRDHKEDFMRGEELNKMENQSATKSYKKLIESGISFLCWISPFFGLGIFFPIGVLTLYTRNVRIRVSAFNILIIQLFAYIVTYPLELYTYTSEINELTLNHYITENVNLFKAMYSFAGLATLVLQRRFLMNRIDRLSFLKQFEFARKYKLMNLAYLIILWAVAIIFTEVMLRNGDSYKFSNMPVLIYRESLIYFLCVLFAGASVLGQKNVFFFLRKPFLSLYVHSKLDSPTRDFQSPAFIRKSRFAKIREYILPGWGQVYLGRYWKGFPLLFIYLLCFFFFILALFLYIDPVLFVRFMSSLGLKPGISDKDLFQFTSNIFIPVVFGSFLIGAYIFAQYMINKSLKQDNQSEEDRGLDYGFLNNIHLSLLMHLVVFSIIFIIPITLQRSSSKSKTGENSKSHYQPEKFEFYFIDPDIPDEVKDLNGGVISGTKTASQKEGIKIPDEKPSDNGKVKGYVKRIRGKKLPKT
ncbi:MAG: hypothetical protein K8R21_03595, partial [Leptospira sp.]|nr:hypothetical protein [Leptospira sp.]